MASHPPQVSDPFSAVHDVFNSTAFLLARNLALFFVGVFWLATAYWVYKDARRRIDDPWLVGGAVLLGLFPPFVGPLIYVLFRPGEYLADARARELEIEEMELALRRRDACPVCRTPVDPEFLACPVCRTKLKQACAGCDAPLEPAWQVCPWCETPNDTPAVVGRGRTAAKAGTLDEVLRTQANGAGGPARRRPAPKAQPKQAQAQPKGRADPDATPVSADGQA